MLSRPTALALGLSIRTTWLANYAKSQIVPDAFVIAPLRVVNERISGQPGIRQGSASIVGVILRYTYLSYSAVRETADGGEVLCRDST
jgi:hypothetical protein